MLLSRVLVSTTVLRQDSACYEAVTCVGTLQDTAALHWLILQSSVTTW